MTNQELLQLLHREVIPAIGCTEPIAVALCTARAKELLGTEPESITVYLSKNVYKNALAVGIPNTGMTGLPIAIALGATVGKSEYMLEVLRDATPEAVAYAKAYMLRVPATIKVDYEAPSLLYIHVEVSKEGQTAQATIIDEHTNFVESHPTPHNATPHNTILHNATYPSAASMILPWRWTPQNFHSSWTGLR
jgi:L-cysteine desulfidase